MGRERELAEVVSRLGLEEHVRWLCGLPDEHMPRLFSSATALVFPSLFEGGGIPVMEAMACGCPVTASDIPTTQEFAGDAAFMFDGTDVESITEALLRFSESADLRETHRLRGLLAAEELRGEKCFAEISSAYRIATKGNAAA